MSECGSVKGAYTADVVHVGWYGHLTTKNAYIRIGPADNFPVKEKMGPNHRVGVQSTRNPKGVDNPPKRPIHRDSFGRPWVWVYHDKTVGWMKLSVLKETKDGPWAYGPNGREFHVGLEPARTHVKSSCHGARRNRVRTIAAREVAVRYAPSSTAFYYLQQGDGVRELYRRIQNDYSAISVTHSDIVPIGTRGWVDVRALAGEKASGIDLSSKEGWVDFHAVRSNQDFVVCKATEGKGWVDNYFFRNVKEAKEAYLHVGAYHVLQPSHGSGSEEAEDFIRALRLAKITSTDIRPTVSVKQSKMDRDETQRYTGEFIGAMRLAGFDCMLLTYPKFMDWTKAFNADLWIEHYGFAQPILPKPWGDYALWRDRRVTVAGAKVARSQCPDLARIVQR